MFLQPCNQHTHTLTCTSRPKITREAKLPNQWSGRKKQKSQASKISHPIDSSYVYLLNIIVALVK